MVYYGRLLGRLSPESYSALNSRIIGGKAHKTKGVNPSHNGGINNLTRSRSLMAYAYFPGPVHPLSRHMDRGYLSVSEVTSISWFLRVSRHGIGFRFHVVASAAFVSKSNGRWKPLTSHFSALWHPQNSLFSLQLFILR